MRFYVYTLSLFLLVGFIAQPQTATATGSTIPIQLGGWAWSGYEQTDPETGDVIAPAGVGWISFSCENTSSCAANGGFDYGVQIEPDGSLTGHAWSSTIGWIQFDGLSDFPSGAGTVAASARAVGTYPNLRLEGWARACAGTENGDCSTMTDADGGWDGWISLAGTAVDSGGNPISSNYDITFDRNGARNNSYSWGGPVNVGWMDWSPTGSITPVNYLNPVDIAIRSFVLTPSNIGTINPVTGLYDQLTFDVDIIGIPEGETADWQLRLPGTGIAHQTGTLAEGNHSIQVTSVDVPYDAPQAVFVIDWPEPGEVEEIEERDNNRRTIDLSGMLSLPDPTLELSIVGDQDVVRVGETIEISYNVESVLPTLECRLAGRLPVTEFTLSGGPGSPATASDTVTSDPLQNSGVIAMRCETSSGMTFEESVSYQVVPASQEI